MRLALLVLAGVALGVLVARVRPTAGEPAAAAEAATADADVRPAAPATRPRITSTPRVRQRDLPATDARYDPVALLGEEDGVLSPQEIFEAEPRDPVFAPILERRIHTALELVLRELELGEIVRDIRVECKTLSCSTRIEVTKADARQVYDDLNGIMLGDVQTPGIDESGAQSSWVTFDNLYRSETRGDAYYERFLEEAMRPALDVAKQALAKRKHEAPR